MAKTAFKDLRVYQLAETLADQVWVLVASWDRFAKDTLGKQVVRASDSVGANIAEGAGRGSFVDNRRFVKIARGSLYEVMHLLRRAYQRNLVDAEQTERLTALLDELGPRLNAYLRSIGAPRRTPTTDN